MEQERSFDGRELSKRKKWLVGALDDWTETVDPCADGHTEHDAAAHTGRRLVHTFLRGVGADWDYDAAVEYIGSATSIANTADMKEAQPFYEAMGYGGAAKGTDGRWIVFATRSHP